MLSLLSLNDGARFDTTYNPSTDTWTEAGQLIEPKYYHASTTVADISQFNALCSSPETTSTSERILQDSAELTPSKSSQRVFFKNFLSYLKIYPEAARLAGLNTKGSVTDTCRRPGVGERPAMTAWVRRLSFDF